MSNKVATLLKDISNPAKHSYKELVKALERDKAEPGYIRLAQIFSTGAYSDYLEERNNLPPIDSCAEAKLKMLGLCNLCVGSGKKTISFDELKSGLGIETDIEFERLVIEAIQGGLIVGKMDQKDRTLVIDHVAPRDNLSAGQVHDSWYEQLDKWKKVLVKTVYNLDAAASQAKKLSSSATLGKQYVLANQTGLT